MTGSTLVLAAKPLRNAQLACGRESPDPRIRTCDPLEVFVYILSLPTVSENPRIPLCLQGTGRFTASNCVSSFWAI